MSVLGMEGSVGETLELELEVDVRLDGEVELEECGQEYGFGG